MGYAFWKLTISHGPDYLALEETLFWYNGGSDEKSQNLAALKLEVLGPYLFSRNVLCDEVIIIVIQVIQLLLHNRL